jgi:hypothetical protein
MLAQESEQRAGACGTEFLLSNKNNIIYLAGARLAGQAKRRVSTAHHADSTFKISKSSRLAETRTIYSSKALQYSCESASFWRSKHTAFGRSKHTSVSAHIAVASGRSVSHKRSVASVPHKCSVAMKRTLQRAIHQQKFGKLETLGFWPF